MKHKLKKNKSRHQERRKKSIFLIPAMNHAKYNINHAHKELKEGFVAWPESGLPHVDKDKKSEGRSRSGGYVAYPVSKESVVNG
ncbi:MAG: hypothetical protein Q8891_10765 [Bacteroidota bacterium]|jgi:hypothetical protein|nr:hypothetical protein [Bacteroidota bacterium]